MQETKSDNGTVVYERIEHRTNLHGAYFRMGLCVGLAIAIVAVYITYEIMS